MLPERRLAGVCAPITALPGPFGSGEIGAAARQFIEQLATMQLGLWQVLPLGPTGYGDSPYQPLSCFAGNELLIDLQELIDGGLLSTREVEALRALPHDRVDYGRLIALKPELLSRAASRFDAFATPAEQTAFANFLQVHGVAWLDDYVLYRSLKTAHQERPWYEWPAPLAQRDPDALARYRDENGTALRALMLLQFFFFRQWRQLRDHAQLHGVTLFGDMPIYMSLDSADAWAHPELLQTDADGWPDRVAGVPPDYFSETGQLWGNPLYDWEFHARTHYDWWVRRVEHALGQLDTVRIDHFRGFESFWSVPADAKTAQAGRWEPGPGDELFDALRARLGAVSIVAEDLGIITAEVDALRDRQGIPGMRVLQFDVADREVDLAAQRPDSVCYTGTHDNDTTVGWFTSGASDDDLADFQALVLERTGGCAETIHADLIRLAFASPARWSIAPLQDYLGLGSAARLNRPGTTSGNWQWRVQSSQLADSFKDLVATWVRAAERNRT